MYVTISVREAVFDPCRRAEGHLSEDRANKKRDRAQRTSSSFPGAGVYEQRISTLSGIVVWRFDMLSK